MSKTLHVIFAFLLLALAGGIGHADSVPATANEVPWLEGQPWTEIVDLASESGQPIFIDFYATWCGPCKRLDKEVYTQAEVIAELGELITYKVDVDKEEFKDLVRQFHIFNMPTLVLCTSDGTEVDRFLGYRPAEEFLSIVRDYRAGRNTLADLDAQLVQDPDDVQLLLATGEKYAGLLQQEIARTRIAKILELDAENDQGAAAAALEALADLERKLGNYDAAIATARRSLADYPEAVDPLQTMQSIAYYQKKNDDLAGMVQTYREIVAFAPEDISALNAFAWNAAQAGIALEEATNMALKAVALSDDDPGIVDTLAEVYHQRGLHQQAIAWIKKAIAKEPDDQYLQDQLAKFSGAAQAMQP